MGFSIAAASVSMAAAQQRADDRAARESSQSESRSSAQPASQLDYLPDSLDPSAISTTPTRTTGFEPVTKVVQPHDEIFYEGADQLWQPYMEFANDFGAVGVATNGQPLRTKGHPFFEPLNESGRACITCHQPRDGMSLSVDTARKIWAEQGSNAPLFDVWDGANCPNLPRGERESHSLLLDRGLIRIARPWPVRDFDGQPVEAEFTIEVVQDPTGCNLDPVYGIKSDTPMISVYRRPRPVANLRFLETPRIDRNAKTMQPMDRDPVTHARSSMSMMADARITSLRMQNQGAMREHLQFLDGMPDEKMEVLLAFQRAIHVAQARSNGAGDLDEPGGPSGLGINSMVTGTSHLSGNDRDAGTFFLMEEWRKGGAREGITPAERAFRGSVVRGYDLFFLEPLFITETPGVNNIRLGSPFKQTCGFCHNTQLTGHDNVPGWMDIGTNNFPHTQHADRSSDLPMFKVTCKPSAPPHPYLGRVIFTRDPGRALVSGKCIDVGGTVMQQFRGIASRAPYFVNGSASTLREMIDYYDRRYLIGFSDQDKQDLINFFSVL